MHPSRQHRHFELITGSPESCRTQAARHWHEDALWIGRQAPAPVRPLFPQKLAGKLGLETDLLIYDALEALDPDAFAMALGLVRGGGRFLLLAPPLESWPRTARSDLQRLAPAGWPAAPSSRFLQRLARLLEKRTWSAAAPAPQGLETGTLTGDQERALALFRHAATGHAGRPLVITAHRGRGKSTLLGLGAAWLMQERPCRILATAPRRSATEILFRQARTALAAALEEGQGKLAFSGASLTFIAPDALAAATPPADLLLVDEAAGIPLPLLEKLLRRYKRAVLASTVHGYEGSGRGFLLRLAPLLDRIRPQWRSLHMEQPVRWAAGDPLEEFGFRALLLDAEPAPVAGNAPTPEACRIRAVTAEELLQDEGLLQQLFGLLASAHYRTTPRDLRYLLDAPNLLLQGLFQDDALVGAALVAREGALEPGLRQAICSGHRRPRGHLLPQLLASRCQLPQALAWPCERVVRIAIHPRLQGRGLGSRLLHQLAEEARGRGAALLGASFGATAPLVRFWKQGGFLPLRLGHRRESSSGAHALVMVRPLTAAAEAAVAPAAAAFQEDFPAQLGGFFRSLDPRLALELRQPPANHALGARDLAVLEQFASGRLPWLDALGPLHRLACQLADARDPDQQLLVMKALQNRSWEELARELELPGKRALEERLRQAVLDLTQCPPGKRCSTLASVPRRNPP